MKRIRLTESQLNRMIMNTVNRVIKEGLPDFEEVDDDYATTCSGNRIADSIKNGRYDDKIFDDKFVDGLYFQNNDYDRYGANISRSVEDRRCYLDKDYANKTLNRKYQDDNHPLIKKYDIGNMYRTYGNHNLDDTQGDYLNQKDTDNRSDYDRAISDGVINNQPNPHYNF